MSLTRFNLSVDQTQAELSGDTRFPASIIRGLGIDYDGSETQPVGTAFLFRGCTNIPPRLPAYVRAVA